MRRSPGFNLFMVLWGGFLVAMVIFAGLDALLTALAAVAR